MNTVDGADPETVRASIEEAVKDYVIVQVLDREQFKGQQRSRSTCSSRSSTACSPSP